MEMNYDAIVIGTGMSGGWAAKELCEKGLKTLVLERGRMIKHIEDYKTANKEDWEFPAGDVITQEIEKRQPKQSRTGYVNTESTKDFFVDDIGISLENIVNVVSTIGFRHSFDVKCHLVRSVRFNTAKLNE